MSGGANPLLLHWYPSCGLRQLRMKHFQIHISIGELWVGSSIWHLLDPILPYVLIMFVNAWISLPTSISGLWNLFFRCIQGTLPHEICLLANNPLILYVFSDVDWAGCPITRRFTTRYWTYLGGNCILWSAKKQPTVARSSTEAEYMAMASTTAELAWIMFLVRDMVLYLDRPLTLFCDHNSVLHLTIN